jgi:hypothetical protein
VTVDEEQRSHQQESEAAVLVDEVKVARLKRNRTDLELNSQDRVWVCSLRSCHAIFKSQKNLGYHMTCHKGE